MPLHKDLTGADLHEPKGIGSATSGQVYRADGSGSGSWQTLTLPTGTFKVNIVKFTSTGTWTKPANFFGAFVHLMGGGGAGSNGGGNGNPGGQSSIGSAVTCAGGKAASTTTNGGASTDAGTSGFDLVQGSAGTTGSPGTGGACFGPYNSSVTGGSYGYGGSDTHSGGGGAAKWGWLQNSQLGSSETVTVGAGGTGTASGVNGVAGLVVIYEYTTL